MSVTRADRFNRLHLAWNALQAAHAAAERAFQAHGGAYVDFREAQMDIYTLYGAERDELLVRVAALESRIRALEAVVNGASNVQR